MMRRWVTRRAFGALVMLLAAAVLAPAARAEAPAVRVFAATSLKDAFEAAAAAWQARGGGSAVFSFASPSTLAKQIEQGAPADLFASADLDWMDYLAERGLIDAATRANLLGNTLVLIAPADDRRPFTLAKGADLAAFVGDGRLAVGEVNSVPAGKYAKEALTSLGLWAGVESKLAQTDTVRAALALVARGEAAAGIVYGTDAKSEPRVRVIATFPADSHTPIVYPIARMAASANPDAAAFLAFLKSDDAAAIYRRYGFTVLK